MKKLVFLFACLFFMGIAVESVKAQNTATANANAAATIVTPIKITKTVDLNFGAIVPSSTAGTVVVGYDNSRTGSGVTLISQLGTHSAASFTVTGEANASFYVSLPTEEALTISGGGSETMTVSSFFHNATGTLDGTGAENFNVGATLAVAANQVPGLYNGTFNVTVTYE
jgi:spore coat protein U-like protein